MRKSVCGKRVVRHRLQDRRLGQEGGRLVEKLARRRPVRRRRAFSAELQCDQI